MVYDLVIRNGSIVAFDNPVNNESKNIGILNGKIKTISSESLDGKFVIDATGLIVCPGFIDFHSHVNGKIFSAECAIQQGVTTTIGGERIYESDIVRQIEANGFLINQGFYISSFTLRKAIGLHDPTKQPTEKEIFNMVNLADRFFQFGVFGIHFGLEYVPGTTERELEELLLLTKKYQRIAMVHIRRDGYDALAALDEIIHLAKKTSAAINILHVMYTVGLNGALDSFIKKIDDARNEGCNITADTGVYAAYPVSAGAMALSDDWIKKYELGVSEKNLLISSGIHIGEFCDHEMFEYLRKEHPSTLLTAFLFDEKMIPKALLPEYMMLSTNAGYGPHCKGVGLPDSIGTFPKLISEYVRNTPVLTLHEAIKKATYMPAKLLGLSTKGDIKEGMDADLTIFNYETIEPKAEYSNVGDPTAPPKGIEYVIINGKLVLRKGTILPENRHCGILLKCNQ